MGFAWRTHFVTQTDYQLWADQVMFDSLERLHPDALRADEGLFFGSVLHTVDHMLIVLQLWRGRLCGQAPVVDLRAPQHADWATLKRALQDELRQLRHWLQTLDETDFERRVAYARLDGDRQDSRLADILSHLMTHFAHHRGQVSAVATRLGAPAPEMDFIYFVRAMERAAREVQAARQQQ